MVFSFYYIHVFMMYVVFLLGFLLLFFPSFSCYMGYLPIGLPWINMFVLSLSVSVSVSVLLLVLLLLQVLYY